MFEIKIQHNLDELKFKLEQLEKKKWAKVLSYASTETAFYVRNKLRKEMPNHISNPKPFTVNSIFVKKEEGSEAVVQWRKPSGGTSGGRYLKPTVDGGQRQTKRFERALQFKGLMNKGDYAVPTNELPRDMYGNVPSQRLNKIIQAVIFNPYGSQYKNDKKTYFVVTSRAAGKGLAPGIYERIQTAFKGPGFNGTAIRKLFSFVPSTIYKTSFPFYEIGNKASVERFPAKLDEAIRKSLEGWKRF